MESKIEKIEGAYDIPILKDKLNKIIDHLNSQDQGEEKTVCEGCGKAIISRFMQSYSRDDGLHYYCLSCNPETEDTPEEIEEWKKRYVKRFGYWSEEIKFIQQLLDEREKEVRKSVLKEVREWLFSYLVKLNKEEK